MPLTKITEEHLTRIEHEYTSGTESLSAICKRHGANAPSINKRLRARGITIRSNRIHTDNDAFFERIDTEEKAYVLGFLYADGCVAQNSGGGWIVKLFLAEQDEQILVAIRDLLGPTRPIERSRPKDPRAQNVVGFCICGHKMAHDLIALGCTPRKSLTLTLPSFDQVPRELFRHFLRGYFDGDGCFSVGYAKGKPYPKAAVHIESSVAFTTALGPVLSDMIGVTSFISRRTPTRGSRSLKISGNRQIILFLRWIYEGATIYLHRKRTKADAFLLEYEPFSHWKPETNLGEYVKRRAA